MLFAGKAESPAQIAPRPLRLTSFSEDRNSRIDFVNHADAPALSRGDQAIKSDPLTVSGAYLMNHGLTLPWSFPETMWVVKGSLM